jgi:Flp pilus assembly protein TadG
MALVMPLLLALMFGSAEIGNYFMNEHRLVKAVRDGARYAARQSFANYTACSGSPSGTVENDTENVVMNGYLTGGTLITPNITRANITVTTTCVPSAGGQNMLGIYRGIVGCGSSPGCAPIVTVTAQVPYAPILGSFGFKGFGMQLNASSQAAVAGI